MSIFAIEAAESFGALDWDAMADGVQVDANACRAIGRQANRLLRKRHQILSLVWPITTTTIEDFAQYPAEFIATPADGLILPPLAALKKPGLTSGTAYVRWRATSSARLSLRVGTRAVDVSGQQSLDVTGSGAWAWSEIPLTLQDTELEEISLYVRATRSVGALMDTATFGSPNQDDLDADYLVTATYLEKVAGSNPSWTDQVARHGHAIQFLDGSEVLAVSTIRGVVAHSGNYALHFDPLPSQVSQRILQGRAASGTRIQYEIREIPWIAMAQLLVVTGERSF